MCHYRVPFLSPPKLVHHFSTPVPVFFPPLELLLTPPPFAPMPSLVRAPFPWISFPPSALLTTVDIPDEIPLRGSEPPGGRGILFCLRCLSEVDICCVGDRARGCKEELVTSDMLVSNPDCSGRFRFLEKLEDSDVVFADSSPACPLLFDGGWARERTGLKPLSHCFLCSRKIAIVARASVTCSIDQRQTYEDTREGEYLTYTTVFAALDDDIEFLLYKDTQSWTTRLDDTVLKRQRLGITELRGWVGEQE